MFIALYSVGLLDILLSMPAGPSVALAGKLPDAPCIHARLRRLATKTGAKCGLASRLRSSLHISSVLGGACTHATIGMPGFAAVIDL
jgi:hypothetical protein